MQDAMTVLKSGSSFSSRFVTHGEGGEAVARSTTLTRDHLSGVTTIQSVLAVGPDVEIRSSTRADAHGQCETVMEFGKAVAGADRLVLHSTTAETPNGIEVTTEAELDGKALEPLRVTLDPAKGFDAEAMRAQVGRPDLAYADGSAAPDLAPAEAILAAAKAMSGTAPDAKREDSVDECSLACTAAAEACVGGCWLGGVAAPGCVALCGTGLAACLAYCALG